MEEKNISVSSKESFVLKNVSVRDVFIEFNRVVQNTFTIDRSKILHLEKELNNFGKLPIFKEIISFLRMENPVLKQIGFDFSKFLKSLSYIPFVDVVDYVQI
ncbi:hypothetical protein EHQ76_03265 [Leptospira barantonii]|uniref:Uncharacterized protein n=1 Tax=Leptospira barantonii TaxID=2023184 RepID=A0A5F2BSP2_9LEPT|nr:hypothetical protein EHQ76_03265 [Leptospira barantonii]